jgi:hypothetical protein
MVDAISHIFLDTNTLLHFKRPDLLDWKAFVPSTDVVLVVCPALIDELETIKSDPKSPRKLRARAHNAIMWISNMMELTEPVQIARAVRLIFITESPTIDFASHRLSYTVPDDQLIASAIQYRDQTGANVSFFSNDTGLRLKLRSRGLTGFTLPQSERLPDELDEDTKRVRTLEARIASFENRQPQLVLTFSNETKNAKIMLRSVDQPESPQTHFTFRISRESVERYHTKHAEYQTKYEAWASQAALRFPIRLILTNEGSAVATDILLTLMFPNFITALPNRAVLTKPPLPKAPVNPLLNARQSLSSTFTPPIMPHVSQPTDAHINTRSNTVTFRVPALVQGRTLTLDPFFLMFDSKDEVQNYSFDYSMSLVEHPEGIRGTLYIVLDNTNIQDGE